MKDIIYPAIFVKEAGDNDGSFAVIFPDILGAVTQGDDLPEAFRMGTELLTTLLYWDYEDGKELPKPSPVNEVDYVKYWREHYNEEPSPDDEWFVSLVTTRFLANRYNEAVERVNCTMPGSLKAAAQRAGLNFSMILQEGIKEALGIVEKNKTKQQ
jgi:predicted RNase H-like HicB family nuclease